MDDSGQTQTGQPEDELATIRGRYGQRKYDRGATRQQHNTNSAMTEVRTCTGTGSEHSHPGGERRHGEAGRVSAYPRKPGGWRGDESETTARVRPQKA